MKRVGTGTGSTSPAQGSVRGRHVVIFQRYLTHYRSPFFSRLTEALATRGIHLSLVLGPPDEASNARRDSAAAPDAIQVPAHRVIFGKVEGVWLPMPRGLPNPDLVVLPQESKLLANYVWLLRRRLGGPRVAYWGHGVNFQSDAPSGWRERWKRMLVGQVDWWFAYTSKTHDVLVDAGYPADRISVVNNALDNTAFRAELDAVTDADLVAQRRKVGAGETAPIGLFCGSLYADKRLDILIAAADRIRANLPDFHLFIIGDGPSRQALEVMVADRPWIHLFGALYGADKAICFRLADIVLNPGLVGLHILDAFCARLPIVTTAGARHSPEIAYLESGSNGFMVAGNARDYADTVIDLLRQPGRLADAGRRAGESAQQYTLTGMVDRFVDGIVRCLEQDRHATT